VGIFSSTNNNNYFSSYIDIKAISTPSSPNSGIGRIFHRSSDGVLCFKKSNGSVVEIESSGGSVTTASNVGSGSGWFKTLNGTTLEFKSLVAGSNQLSITSNTNDLTVDVVEANIKLDDLGAPEDNTDLNASVSAHGLLRKLTGGTTNFLREDGTWAAPPGAGGGISDIASANDVTFTNLQDEDLMRYDTTGSEWINGKLIDANVDAAAAIAYSKLDLADSIVNADVNSAAAIAYSKLALTDSIVNTDINSAAAIVYSKLDLTDSVVNADINSAAAVDWSKISKSGSVLDDIGDVNEASPAQYDVVQRNGSSEWVGAKITNDNIDASAAIATSKLADSATILLTTNAKTVTNKTIDSINNTMKNLGHNAYEVFTDSTNWYARNTKTGAITSTDTDLTVVLQAAIDALTAARTVIETVKVKGTGTLDSITLPSYTRLDLTEASLTWAAHVNPTALADNLITNDDHVGGNTNIEIIGGIIDGNRTNQYPYTASPPLASLEIANIVHFENVTNSKVLYMEINNTPSRAIRFVDCVNCIGAFNTSDLANAEAFMIHEGSTNSFLFNHVTNSLASFITTYLSPNGIIHGNYGESNTGAFSGYNISSLDTIFTDNTGTDTGSAVLTMSEATDSHLGSFSVITGNNLSYSRAAEGISCLSAINQTGLVIKGNHLHHNFRHGARIASVKTGIQLEGNHAYENGMGGLSVHSGSTNIPDQIAIHDNFCWNNNTSGSSNNHEKCGIAVYSTTSGEYVTNVTVHHNHCFDTHPVNADKTQIYGIYIEDTTDATVSFNNCTGNKTDGILVEGTNSGLRMFENLGYSSNVSLVTLTGTETLTNKTLTSPTIATIINGAGTLTLPNITTTLIGRTTVDTMTNKTLTSPTINSPTLTNSGNTLTLPTTTDTLVGRATTDTLTNKTLTSPTINSPTLTNSGNTLTLPTSTDTLVGRATTDTLTNKTLTSPTINSASMSGTITIPVAAGPVVATPLVFEKTAGSGADGIVEFRVSDDTTSKMLISNITSSDTNFSPQFTCIQKTTFPAITYTCQGTTDSGTNPLFILLTRISTSTAVATRPLFAINNATTAVENRVMTWNATNVEFADTYNMKFNTTTGTKIGTATTEKLAFFNSTPVTQRSFISSPSADSASLKTAVDAIRTLLSDLGLMAAS
jgi:hypothetical protein